MADSMQFNSRFFEELGNSPEVIAACRRPAEEAMANAKASAPRDTADYVNGIHIEVQDRKDRKAVVVVASDWKSLLIEAKTGNLARALKAVKRG